MLSVIPVAIGRPLDRFGLKTDADPHQPPIIDLVSPQQDYQEKALANYNVAAGRLVSLSGVIPSSLNQAHQAPQVAEPAPSTSPIIDQVQEIPLLEHPNEGESSIAERLRTLDGLKNQGLISAQEYEQQRRKILSDI